MAHIHAKDWHRSSFGKLCGAQNSSVAAQHEDEFDSRVQQGLLPLTETLGLESVDQFDGNACGFQHAHDHGNDRALPNIRSRHQKHFALAHRTLLALYSKIRSNVVSILEEGLPS